MPSTTVPSRVSKGLKLGRVLGAPVVLAWSWFLAAGIITLLFTPWVRGVRPDLGTGAYFVAFAYAVLLFFSVFLHEVAHAVAARAYGHQVVAIELDVWGGHTSFTNVQHEAPRRSAATGIVISIVGPVVNLVLAGLGFLTFSLVPDGSVAWLLLIAVTFANVALGIINLLPGIPLDGGRALESLVWRVTGNRNKGTIVASWVGRGVAVLVVAVAIIPPLLAGSTPDLITVATMVLIAVFLWSSAQREGHNARLRQRVEAYDLSQVTQTAIAADRLTTVSAAMATADTIGVEGVLIVVVDSKGVPMAVVDRSAAEGIPRQQWAQTTLDSVSRVLGPWMGVPRTITTSHLLESLTHRPDTVYVLVLDHQTLVGLIDVQELFGELLDY